MAFAFCLSVFSQNVNLSKLDSIGKAEYLTKKALEVASYFCPKVYKEYGTPDISDAIEYRSTRPEDQANVGRKFYKVYFKRNHKNEKLDWRYMSKIWIWEDNGEPLGVYYGDGMGRGFEFHPYDQWIKEGVEEKDQMPTYPKN